MDKTWNTMSDDKLTSEFKTLFEDIFYTPTYLRWRINKEKAAKDIVGEQYELFRKEFYKNFGFQIGKGKRIFGASYNADVVVQKGNKILILEEAKAAYVDLCFLKRAISNAAEIFFTCLKANIDAPYFVISSSTKYLKFDEKCEEIFPLYREEIEKLLREKFVYLPLCENDRITKKKYFTAPESCFNLSDKLIQNQNTFVKRITLND